MDLTNPLNNFAAKFGVVGFIPWQVSNKDGKCQFLSKEWLVWCKVICEHLKDAVNWFINAPKCDQVWWSVKKYVMWMWQSCHTEKTLTIRRYTSSATVHLPVQIPVPNHPALATSEAFGEVAKRHMHLHAHLRTDTWPHWDLEVDFPRGKRSSLTCSLGWRSFLGLGFF